MATSKVEICDTCLTFAYDEGAKDYETQVQILVEMGEFMPDHNCDHVDEPNIPCACPAHKR